METVFGPIGDSDVIGLTASSQAFALGTMAELNPAIRLIAMTPSHLAWYLKFGTSGSVTVARTDGMRVVPGSQDKSVIIPVPSGATHVAIICEGASGDALLSYGGFDNGEFSPAGASQVIAVTTTDQRVELPALADDQPAIRLVSVASSIQSLWVKLGDVTVVGDVTSSMKIAPGSVEHPTLIPVTDGETHLSIFCEGVGGDVVLTPGGIASGINTAATSVLFSTGPRILGRTNGAGPGEELTLSQVLDFIGSAEEGDALIRGVSAWERQPAIGRKTIWVPVGDMIPRPPSPCGSATIDSGSNDNAFPVFDFDQTNFENACFNIAMPKSWDGTISFQPYWTASGGTPGQTARFTIGIRPLSDDDSLDASGGTFLSSDDTLIATNDLHIGPESSTSAVTGVAEGDLLYILVFRGVDLDNLAADARLIGIKLFYTTNALTDD